jgi:ACR3 family arsenite transporter
MLIKPFTMFGIASLFFFVVFKSLIPDDLANQYLAGACCWAPLPVPPWFSSGAI